MINSSILYLFHLIPYHLPISLKPNKVNRNTANSYILYHKFFVDRPHIQRGIIKAQGMIVLHGIIFQLELTFQNQGCFGNV